MGYENIMLVTMGVVFLIVAVTSVIIPQIKNANTTGWTTGEVALWGLGSFAAIGSVTMGIMRGLMG